MSWKKTMTALAVVVTLTAPAALQAQHQAGALLTGTFDLEFAAPWGVVVWQFELEQRGETVSGTCVLEMGTLVLDGTVKGHDIEFVVDVADGPHALTIEYSGQASDSEIGGAVTFEDGSSAEWTFKKVEGA